jgi:hypothetical protein
MNITDRRGPDMSAPAAGGPIDIRAGGRTGGFPVRGGRSYRCQA